MKRVFVEKKPGFRTEADGILADLRETLHLPGLKGLRLLRRYDIDGIADADFAKALNTVFVEPPVDDAHDRDFPRAEGDTVFAAEYLPGQYDQRADSDAQCVQMLTHGARPLVATANVFVLTGPLNPDELATVKRYLINPVDSREASLAVPATLAPKIPAPDAVPVLTGFNTLPAGDLAAKRRGTRPLRHVRRRHRLLPKVFPRRPNTANRPAHGNPDVGHLLERPLPPHHLPHGTRSPSKIEPSPLTAPLRRSLEARLPRHPQGPRPRKEGCLHDGHRLYRCARAEAHRRPRRP